MDQRAAELAAGQRVTIVGAVGNLALCGGKYVVGVVANSRGLVADAAHSLSDLLSDAIVLIGLRLGRAAPDEDHHFGHGRMETLASVLVGLVLLVLAAGVGYEAALSIYNFKAGAPPTWPAAAIAALSILVKEWLYRYTIRVAREIRSTALVANAWHHRSDALSSVAVLAGVAGALIEPSWQVLDSFAALLVAALVARVGLEVLWRGIGEMTDKAPPAEVVERITRVARETDGVLDVHDLKVRSSAGAYLVQLHVVVDSELTVLEGHRIAQEVERHVLDRGTDVSDVIVHVDPDGEEHTGL